MAVPNHTQLEEALALATQRGYRVHADYLNGCGGGLVFQGGDPWILLDDMHSPAEQAQMILRIVQSPNLAEGTSSEGLGHQPATSPAQTTRRAA